MEFGGVNKDAKNQEWLGRLKCAVCLEVFQDPRMLPCHHSFCLHCLQDLASQSSSFPCPQCRSPVSVTPEGVSQFQRNYYLMPEELEAARKIDEDNNVDQSGIARSSSHQDDLLTETSTESHRTADSSTDDDWLMASNLMGQGMPNNSSNSVALYDLYSREDPFLLPGQLSAEVEEKQEEDEELQRAIQESLQCFQADAPWEQAGQQAGQGRRVPGYRDLQKTVASEAVQAWNQRRQSGEPSNNQRPRPQPLPADQSNTPAEQREFQQSLRLPTKAEEKGGEELQRAFQKRVQSSQADAPREQAGQQKTTASEIFQGCSQRRQAEEPLKNQRPTPPTPADQKNDPEFRGELEDILRRRESLPSAQRRLHGLLRPGQEGGGQKQEQRKSVPVLPSRPVLRPVREGQGGGQQRTEQDQGSELQHVFKRIQSRREEV